MNNEDFQLEGTAEMAGAEPKDASETNEGPLSYEDIDQQRLEDATKRVRNFASKASGFMTIGKEKYNNLQGRASDAKAIFQAAIVEARHRRSERLAKSSEMQKNPEYALALENLNYAKTKLEEVETRISMEGQAA